MVEEKSLEFLGFPTYSILSSGHVRDLRTGSLHEGYVALGYRKMTLKNPTCSKPFLIHRLVGLAFIPEIPGKPEIDHINRNGLDNRVENLRWADDYDQTKNRGNFKNNKLKEKYINIDCNRFKVQITINKVKIFNKRFDTLDEAIQARDNFLSATD